jgi:hypothetical protein
MQKTVSAAHKSARMASGSPRALSLSNVAPSTRRRAIDVP